MSWATRPRTTQRSTPRRPSLPAADDLRVLLEEYDHANRLAIDSVYAQFSPTLDDFYGEELLIVFPPPPVSVARPDSILPEIVLTRTVPGQQPKSVRAPGAAFPLARAERRARAALADASASGAAIVARLDEGSASFWPVQLPRTQLVQLRVLPDGDDVLGLLPSPAASTR